MSCPVSKWMKDQMWRLQLRATKVTLIQVVSMEYSMKAFIQQNLEIGECWVLLPTQSQNK